jgi:glycosyltransferase involved in cell wall biosynthesis
MRLLLTANASYIPPRGGATRSNLVWLKNLAAAGHACRIVAPGLAGQAGERRQMREEEIDRDWFEREAPSGTRLFQCGGVEVFSIAERTRLVPSLREHIAAFRPDWLLVSSEDLGHVLLAEAARSSPGRIVYLAHTPQFFPFGPASWNPDPDATELVRRAAGIVAIGCHAAAYIAEHAGVEPAVIHPPIYGRGPHPNLACFDRGLVTMVNPCAVKGISIFLALADRFPEFEFGAVTGWGTTAEDRRELEGRPNITLLPNYRDIEDLFRRTRLLLMPSLWYEGFGLSVLEAKLRGIPTLSSDSGGLLEGNVGTGLTVPVRGIERFEPLFDERGLPKPVLPHNDIEPWAAALQTLLADRALYEALSQESQRAAAAFVSSIRPERMEEYLATLQPRDSSLPAPPPVESLSAEKRELLLRRLRKAHP